MSAEGSQDAKYGVWVEDTIHPWDKPTISLSEIRELGGLPADCPVAAVDTTTGQKVPLSEDSVHEPPQRESGKPLTKRTQFTRIS